MNYFSEGILQKHPLYIRTKKGVFLEVTVPINLSKQYDNRSLGLAEVVVAFAPSLSLSGVSGIKCEEKPPHYITESEGVRG